MATMAVPPGIALLDAPDVDSVVAANRSLAGRLLASADMWLFVTTAARYADAVPWDLLKTARTRAAATALVLNRVPGEAQEETINSLQALLSGHSLGDVPLFVVPESAKDSRGILEPALIQGLRAWLDDVAASADTRTAVIRQTVGGAIDLLEPTVGTLAVAADDQVTAANALVAVAREHYRKADYEATWAIRDGALLRGEALARWQRLSGSGDLFRIVPTRLGRLPDKIGLGSKAARLRHGMGMTRDRAAWTRDRAASVVGRGGRVTRLQQVLDTDLAAVIGSAAAAAAERTRADWQTRPGGEDLLASHTDPSGNPSFKDGDSDFSGDTSGPAALLYAWRTTTRDLLNAEAAREHAGRRIGPHAVTVSVTLVSLLACAGVSNKRGSTLMARRALEAIFGERAAENLVRTSRDDLFERIGAFLAAEVSRYQAILTSRGVLPSDSEANPVVVLESPGQRLRTLAREATIARLCAGLPAAHTAPARLPRSDPSTTGNML